MSPSQQLEAAREPVRAGRGHIAALDGVRGLAVLIVFFFHYGGGTHSSLRAMRLFGLINKGGWSGVVLFFVLSGFLITGILWDSFADPHWWKKFFARRCLRILPLYYLALTLVVLGSVGEGTFQFVLRHIWIPALFLENIPGLARISDSLPSFFATFHLWSIAVEEQFYLLWPLLLFLQPSRRSAKALCAAVFVASAAFRFYMWWFTPQPVLWEHFLLTQAGALAAGAWLALSYRGPEWPTVVRWAPTTAVIGLAGFVAAGLVSHAFETTGRHMMTFGLPFATLLFASLIALAVVPGRVARVFSMAWLRWLGTISYGVYVYHELLQKLFDHIAQQLAGSNSSFKFLALRFAVAAVGTLAVAELSFQLYEKQFLRLKRFFIPRVGPAPREERSS